MVVRTTTVRAPTVVVVRDVKHSHGNEMADGNDHGAGDRGHNDRGRGCTGSVPSTTLTCTTRAIKWGQSECTGGKEFGSGMCAGPRLSVQYPGRQQRDERRHAVRAGIRLGVGNRTVPGPTHTHTHTQAATTTDNTQGRGGTLTGGPTAARTTRTHAQMLQMYTPVANVAVIQSPARMDGSHSTC